METAWRMARYFGCGSTAKAYRAFYEYVYDTVHHFLKRRRKVSSPGACQFPEERVFGSLGVLKAPRADGRAFVSLRRSQSESRMPEMGTPGLPSGMGNGTGAVRPHPRPSSTLPAS